MIPVVIAICGPAASGKDYLARYLSSCPLGITNIVSDTTRPPREGETDKVDYNFISDDDFIAGINQNKYLEWTRFRGWYYGTPASSICGKINVGVFNLDGIAVLYREQKMGNMIVLPIYLKIHFWTRIKRYIQREGKFSFELLRRMFYDWLDLDNVDTWIQLFPQHIVVKNFYNTQDCERVAQDIVSKYLKEYYQ